MKKSIKLLVAGLIATLSVGMFSACASEVKSVSFRVNDGILQWQYVGDENWNNLYDIEQLAGENGLSAYELAVQQGFQGTKEMWLESLKGADGLNGKPGSDGKPGADGEAGKPGSDGKPGADGKTPYIGDNGNWWIGDEDTGVLAEEKNMEGQGTDGLIFQMTIRGGVAGYEVCGYSGTDKNIFIPDEIFSKPVVSIKQGALPTSITSVKISKHTEYVPKFEDYSNLLSFDFNNAPIETIPANMFYDTPLMEVKNYGAVREIQENAFRNTYLVDFDFSKVVSIGNYAFYAVDWFEQLEYVVETDEDCLQFIEDNNIFLYITDNVTSIGANAFSDTDDFPIYYEGLASSVAYRGTYFYDKVKHTEDGYYYRDMGGYASLLNYDGKETVLKVPKKFGELALTSVENYAFAFNGKTRRVELPAGISVIGNYAFAYNVNLHSLFIPATVAVCGTNLAKPMWELVCEEITSVFYEAKEFSFGSFTSTDIENGSYPKHFVGVKPSEIVDDDVCVYRKVSSSYEVVSIKNKPGVANIPTKVNGVSVTKIGSFALYGDDIMLVAGVNIPNTVKKILTKAFYGVDSLAFVNISKSVEDVNHYAFYDISGTIYIEKSSIPSDWDSSWYYSIDGYKLNAKASISTAGDYWYETVDGKVYLIKYLLPIQAGDTIVVPTQIDGKAVYGVRQYCYKSSVSNDSSNRINIVVSKDIAVIEQYAIYFNSYVYINVFVDWASNESKPANWNSSWLYTYYSSSSYQKWYYAGQWELLNGVPVIK